MKKTNAEQLTDLFGPKCDENGCISLSDAEELIAQSDFSISAVGFDTLLDMLDSLDDQFTVDLEADPPSIKCLLLTEPKTIADEAAPAEDETPKEPEKRDKPHNKCALDARQIQSIIDKIKRQLQLLPKKEGCVYVSALGAALKNSGVKDYGGVSLTEFLKLHSSIFKIVYINGVSLVRLSNTDEEANVVVAPNQVTEVQPAAQTKQPETSAASAALKERVLSQYKLLDFAFIPNYKEVLIQLAQMAEPDGWFVLDEPEESFPGYMIDLKLKYLFAQAVKEQLNGTAEKIKFFVSSAQVDTGFVTKEGAHIIAHFILNRRRNAKDCQNWRFDHFAVEGQETSDEAGQQE